MPDETQELHHVASYVCPVMRRIIGLLLALPFAAVMIAPSLFLLQFTLHRTYIEKELCVQRDVVESMRTCHGECQLSKKFHALEAESQQGFPADRLEFRTEPMIPLQENHPVFIPPSIGLGFLPFEVSFSDGFSNDPDPVPWC